MFINSFLKERDYINRCFFFSKGLGDSGVFLNRGETQLADERTLFNGHQSGEGIINTII